MTSPPAVAAARPTLTSSRETFDVSIVVVTYEAPEWTRRCLSALTVEAVRSSRSIEVIVVDNASGPATRDVLSDAGGATVVLLPENIGFGRACNLGVARSSGRLVMLLNPDAIIKPGAIDALAAFYDDDPGRGIVGGRTLRPDGSLDPRSCWAAMSLWSLTTYALGLSRLARGNRVLDPESMGGWQRDSVREVDVVTGCLLLTSRELWQAVGGFDEAFFMYGEDADLCRRVRQLGYRPAITPDAVVVHAVGASSGTSLDKQRLLLRGRASLVRRQWRGAARVLARSLLGLGVLLRATGSPRGDMATLWRERATWRHGWPDTGTSSGASSPVASSPGRAGQVLVIIQNMPYRFDRRVRHEVDALLGAGVTVSVICPKDTVDEPDLTDVEGATVYSYPPPPASTGVLGYVREFLYCWLHTARLSRRAWSDARFDVIQACNPPDTYWALALLWRVRGVRFVYDQHDLCPEVFVDRFGRRGLRARVLHRGLLALERASYATAHHVISPNPGYAEIARSRGRRTAADTTVVMSSPDPAVVRRGEGVPEARRWRGREFAHLVVYVGVMGPQDGVDRLLRAATQVVAAGRLDTRFVLIGFGDELAGLQALATASGLDDYVQFTGRLPHEAVRAWLSSADLGVTPDPKSEFTDRSTMNKTLEYMACELPVVATDLTETRRCAGAAAVYVDDERQLAAAIDRLLADPGERARMGAIGRARIEGELRWDRYATAYVEAFRALLPLDPGTAPGSETTTVPPGVSLALIAKRGTS